MTKGSFVDFIEEASVNTQLRDQVLNELYKEGVTPEDLLKLFYQSEYLGVSRDDCTKLLRFAGKADIRPSGNFDVKY